MKVNVNENMIQEPEIKRLPFAELESVYYNRFNEEDGIVLSFETEWSIHQIKLNREETEKLERRLSDARFRWRFSSDQIKPLSLSWEYEPD